MVDNLTASSGLAPGQSVTIEGSDVSTYNGTWVINATFSSTSILRVSNAATPGSAGAFGTARLAQPATYYDDLGLATIASMVSSSVARISSSITGAAVNPADIGGDPGVTIRYRRKTATSQYLINADSELSHAFNEENTKALIDVTTVGESSGTGKLWTFTSVSGTDASYSTDFKNTFVVTKDKGAANVATRIKQILIGSAETELQITFNTPFDKTSADRLKVTVAKQIQRAIQIP